MLYVKKKFRYKTFFDDRRHVINAFVDSLLAVDPDDDALGDLCGSEGRPPGGRGPQHLAGRDLLQVEVVGRSAVLVHVRATIPALVVGYQTVLKVTVPSNSNNFSFMPRLESFGHCTANFRSFGRG